MKQLNAEGLATCPDFVDQQPGIRKRRPQEETTRGPEILGGPKLPHADTTIVEDQRSHKTTTLHLRRPHHS